MDAHADGVGFYSLKCVGCLAIPPKRRRIKSAIKREENGICSNYPEREQARRSQVHVFLLS